MQILFYKQWLWFEKERETTIENELRNSLTDMILLGFIEDC